jgi:hypothetical protein
MIDATATIVHDLMIAFHYLRHSIPFDNKFHHDQEDDQPQAVSSFQVVPH